MPWHVLVTGAAGYLGSILVPELLARGFRVTALDTFTRGDTALASCAADLRFEPVRGDVRDEELVTTLLRSADIVVPLAAVVGAQLCKQDPIAARTTNLDAVLMLLRKMSREQRIIYPTTNSGYGIGQKGVFCTEKTPLSPISLYGVTKVQAERQSSNAATASRSAWQRSSAWHLACDSICWSTTSLGGR
jgi:nucleoside-diphosphate-sugar epimerase